MLRKAVIFGIKSTKLSVEEKSLLIKQNQDAAKTDGIDGLINFYSINNKKDLRMG